MDNSCSDVDVLFVIMGFFIFLDSGFVSMVMAVAVVVAMVMLMVVTVVMLVLSMNF